MVEDRSLIPMEQALEAYFRSHEPDAAFLRALEQRLSAQMVIPSWPLQRGARIRWSHVALATILILAVAIVTVGPERVWAALRRWAAYLPGVGQVEWERARALPGPVSRTSQGWTLTVEQFIAGLDETILVARITGDGVDSTGFPGSIRVEWDTGSVRQRAWLTDSVYSACEEGCLSGYRLAGYVVQGSYDPLPIDVEQARLIWTYRASPSDAPVEESISLRLQPIEEVASDEWLTHSYNPSNARTSRFGIGLVVTQVFQGTQGTVVEIQIETPEGVTLPSIEGAYLSSERGDAYRTNWPTQNDFDLFGVPLVTTTPAGTERVALTIWPQRLAFPPVRAPARELTLQVGPIRASYESDFEFPMMLGPVPVAGQVIPLDVTLEVDGFKVHFDQASIVEADRIDAPTPGTPTLTVQLHVDSPVEQDGRRLREIWLSPQSNQDHAEPGTDPATGIVMERLAWDPVFTLVDPMIIRLERIVLQLDGLWVLSWQVPDGP